MPNPTDETPKPTERKEPAEFRNATEIPWEVIKPNPLLRDEGNRAGPTRLLGHVRILGCDFHAEAFLTEGPEGNLVRLDDPDDLDHLAAVSGGEGEFQTVEIPGFPGRWVVAIYPFEA